MTHAPTSSQLAMHAAAWEAEGLSREGLSRAAEEVARGAEALALERATLKQREAALTDAHAQAASRAAALEVRCAAPLRLPSAWMTAVAGTAAGAAVGRGCT